MFSSCNIKFFADRHIHYPVNPSSDHFHTDAVVISSYHCRTGAVLPPSDHYCIDTVAPSGDNYCIDIGLVVASSDHCCLKQYHHLVSITELRKYRHLVITYTLKELNNVN